MSLHHLSLSLFIWSIHPYPCDYASRMVRAKSRRMSGYTGKQHTRGMKADNKDNHILGKLLIARIRKYNSKFLSTYEFDHWRGNGWLFMLLYNSTWCEFFLRIHFFSFYPAPITFPSITYSDLPLVTLEFLCGIWADCRCLIYLLSLLGSSCLFLLSRMERWRIYLRTRDSRCKAGCRLAA